LAAGCAGGAARCALRLPGGLRAAVGACLAASVAVSNPRHCLDSVRVCGGTWMRAMRWNG
jgi:hypothetical protein